MAILVGVAWGLYALWSTAFVAWFGRTARRVLLAHLLALAAVPLTFVVAGAIAGEKGTHLRRR